jgi:hypothetical protein
MPDLPSVEAEIADTPLPDRRGHADIPISISITRSGVPGTTSIARHVSLNWDAVGTMYGQHAFGLEPRGQRHGSPRKR